MQCLLAAALFASSAIAGPHSPDFTLLRPFSVETYYCGTYVVLNDFTGYGFLQAERCYNPNASIALQPKRSRPTRADTWVSGISSYLLLKSQTSGPPQPHDADFLFTVDMQFLDAPDFYQEGCRLDGMNDADGFRQYFIHCD